MAILNHIGIAITDLPRMKKLFALLDLRIGSQEAVPEQGVVTHFIELPQGRSSIELLEVQDPDGTVAQFLKKRGPGVHHLSFTVKTGELDSVCKRLESEGFKLVYPAPKMGAHKMRINFIHPSTAGGILIEVMEAI